MDGGDGDTITMYSVPLIYTLKMVKTVNVMLCAFYHNKLFSVI